MEKKIFKNSSHQSAKVSKSLDMYRLYPALPIFIWTLLLLPKHGQCRLATLQEAHYLADTEISLAVRADGTYTATYKLRHEILTEEGKASGGYMRLRYNPSISKIKVISATTQDPEGLVAKVDEKFIEDKPVAGLSYQSFDLINQLSVLYPQIQIGSVVKLELEQEFFISEVPGVFNYTNSIGMTEPTRSFQLKIDSQVPLFTKILDPKKLLRLERNTFGKKIKIKLKKPVHFQVVDETYTTGASPDIPVFLITNLKNWSPVIDHFLPVVKRISEQPLPQIFEEIAQRAMVLEGSIYDKIEFIMAELQSQIRYAGDWRTVQGRYLPRTPAEILQTRFGDCKDFSILLVSILKRLHLEAHWTLIQRSRIVYHWTQALVPGIHAFNHAIVRVTNPEDPNGLIWVDPTNLVSTAKMVPEDISDRPALSIHAGARPMRVNDPNGEKSSLVVKRTIQSLDASPSAAHVIMNAEAKGELAFFLHSLAQRVSKEQMVSEIFRFLVADHLQKEDRTLSLATPFQKIVSTLKGELSYTDPRAFFKSSVGRAHLIRSSDLMKFLASDHSARASDIFLGKPYSMRFVSSFKNPTQGQIPRKCAVQSKWVDYEVDYKRNPHLVWVSQIKTHVRTIPVSETQSKAFHKFQKDVRECLDDFAIIFEEPSMAKK